MAPLLKTSSFQLPNAQKVETVFVQLADGRIVPRRRDEVIALPTPPPADAKVEPKP